MTLPTGESPISFSQIRTEFGDGTNTSSSPVRLGQYRTTDSSFTNESPGDFSNLPLDTGIPTSGTINVDSFHGKKLNVIVDYYSGSSENRPDDARAKYQAASASGNRVVVGGEVGLTNSMKIEDLSELVVETVRSTVRNIGYEQKGFHWKELEILNLLHQQSPDIAQGVDREGAGDQGIMFGYAVNETPELMPAPLQYAQAIPVSYTHLRAHET